MPEPARPALSRRDLLAAAALTPLALGGGDPPQGPPLARPPGIVEEPDLYPMYWFTAGRTPPEKLLRCPRVDYHVHLRDVVKDEPSPVLEVFRRAGIDLAHNLDGYQGAALAARLEATEERWPARLVTAFLIDYAGIDEPGWGEREAAALAEAHRLGAATVKEHKRLGLTVRDRKGRVAVDDPRLGPVWEKAGELGMPVTIHTTDPEAFWHPVDERNERFEELKEHPGWSFAKGYPSRLEVLEERNRMIKAHPRTTFVGAHVGNNPENLGYVGRCLDEMPNLHVDVAARLAELGRQPLRARKFFLKYADRILFGTDYGVYGHERAGHLARLEPAEREAEIGRQAGWYLDHYRFLETDDFHFPYPNSPRQGRWRISGIELPEEALRKIYYGNAARVCPAVGRRLGLG